MREVLFSLHDGRRQAVQRRPNRVGADPVLAVREAGSELDPIKQLERAAVRGLAVDDAAELVGEQQTDLAAAEVLADAPDDGTGSPCQPATVVYVALIRDVKDLGAQTRAGAAAPRADDVVAHAGGPAGEPGSIEKHADGVGAVLRLTPKPLGHRLLTAPAK